MGRFLSKFARAQHAPQGHAVRATEPFGDENLARLANIDDYATAKPFPHLVIDDFFNPQVLDSVLEEWPGPDHPDVVNFDDGAYTRLKYAIRNQRSFGPNTYSLITRLGEPPFLEALEKATGIDGLIPDPYLRGGGLHFTLSGGRLAIHADFNQHFKFNLDRRLNLILYLNQGWKEDNEGWLELWDREVKSCVQRILPIFNRMVVFSTSDFSFHGQPESIKGPPDLIRKSIALYYYSNGRPAEEVGTRDPKATLWQERPGAGY